MPIWDHPPHSVAVHAVTESRDLGGGTKLTYAAAQSGVPCLINTAGASEVALYAQQNIVVTHTVSFLASALTVTLARGMKLVADDTSKSFHVRGIRAGRAFASIPAFVYADCEEIL